MSIIVIRLHPEKKTDGNTFKSYLDGLEIKVADRSFVDPKGKVNVLGTARYIAEGDPNSTIVQHLRLIVGIPVRQPVATAAIHIPDPLGFPEYKSPDLTLTITRTVPPTATQTVINHDINFNIDLMPGALPVPPPPPNPFAWAAFAPVALYLPLPPPKVGLGPGVAFVDVPTDGTPPPFKDVLDAMKAVVNADPFAPPPDLAALTVEQCRHIAYEIVNNRTLDPLPVPGASLEDMYSGAADTELQQFEANLLTYYTVHNTRAEVLAKFIYSVSQALACNGKTQSATQVGFTFPILPGLPPVGEKIAETTVVISQ
jgi:hypothetical protein